MKRVTNSRFITARSHLHTVVSFLQFDLASSPVPGVFIQKIVPFCVFLLLFLFIFFPISILSSLLSCLVVYAFLQTARAPPPPSPPLALHHFLFEIIMTGGRKNERI